MAVIYPSWRQIEKLREQPTRAERYALEQLERKLPSIVEIFWRPYFNGDRPSIVILKKGFGVCILECIDFPNKLFSFESKKARQDARIAIIRDHEYEANQYKLNMYKLHSAELGIYKMFNLRALNLINTCVFANSNQITDLEFTPMRNDRPSSKRYVKLNYSTVFIKDVFEDNTVDLEALLSLDKVPYGVEFTEKIYNNIARLLKPPKSILQSIPELTKIQRGIAIGEELRKKVSGVVGSGKTITLVAKAIECHKRTRSAVLILVYNKSLRNYIHDRIADIREDLPWNIFIVDNYHAFINGQMRLHNIKFEFPKNNLDWSPTPEWWEENYYSNLNLFDGKTTDAFQTVLIDEIQDYPILWQRMIVKYFLKPSGSLSVFGDEKQNLYSNDLIERKLLTTISGGAKHLPVCFRLQNAIKSIAVIYQKLALAGRYDIDDYSNQLSFGDTPCKTEYHMLPALTGIRFTEAVYSKIIELNEHSNDVSMICIRHVTIRELDAYYRFNTSELTSSTSETKEELYALALRALASSSLYDPNILLVPGSTPLNDKSALMVGEVLAKLVVHDAMGQSNLKEYLASQISDMGFSLIHLREWADQKNILEAAGYVDNGKKTTKLARYTTGLDSARKDLNTIRSFRKRDFTPEFGALKLSTIHSFKGWEAETIFLVLEPRFQNDTQMNNAFNELIYTAMTRAKTNLIVFNLGNQEQHQYLSRAFAALN